jgi:hypothetical protein
MGTKFSVSLIEWTKNMLTKKWQKNLLVFLFIILLTLIIRMPSLAEPAYSDDEHFHLTVGRAIKNGSILHEEISDFHLGKPVLIFLITTLFDNQYEFRLVANLFVALSAIIFFKLSKKINFNGFTSFYLTVIYLLLISTPMVGGNKPYVELFMLPFSLLAILTLLQKSDQKQVTITESNHKIILSGILFGVSFLFKLHAIFDLLTIIVVVALFSFKKNYEKVTFISKILLSFVTLISIVAVLLGFWGVSLQTILILFQRGFVFIDITYQPHLLFNNLVLGRYFKQIMIGLWLIALLLNRRKQKLSIFLFSTWLVFSLISSLMYGKLGLHYSIQFIPSLILVIALLIKNLNTKTRQVFLTSSALLVFILAHLINSKDYQNIGQIKDYYKNFLLYQNKKIDFNDYSKFWGESVLKNKEISDHLITLVDQNEEILIWGTSAEIYTLTDTLPVGKYVWHEHIELASDYESLIHSMIIKNTRYVLYYPEWKQANEQILIKFLEQNYTVVKKFEWFGDETVDLYLKNIFQ